MVGSFLWKFARSNFSEGGLLFWASHLYALEGISGLRLRFPHVFCAFSVTVHVYLDDARLCRIGRLMVLDDRFLKEMQY